MIEWTAMIITLVSANIKERQEHGTSGRTHFGKPMSHNLEINPQHWSCPSKVHKTLTMKVRA
jgi:hypothetical protein